MTFIGIQFETPQQEAERLAQSPEGSTNARLAPLPVTIEHPSRGMIVELPWAAMRPESEKRQIVVVLDQLRPGLEPRREQPRRHDRSWSCTVVASTHSAYPVGGYDLVISEAEIRRGRLIRPEVLLAGQEGA